ncbi:uncharacterized protein LOC116340920 [Contarinia nasturtii]|uniref:uncharacterized protein LOC116340920 n=1 Tax=Contarinia nasturtii TaxID=265458 RepID=UPI0012D475EF|nr:uncharacterized protein LOC116340920 [Contarinia nasturtii]
MFRLCFALLLVRTVLGENVAGNHPPRYSDEEISMCMNVFYDKKYCTICDGDNVLTNFVANDRVKSHLEKLCSECENDAWKQERIKANANNGQNMMQVFHDVGVDWCCDAVGLAGKTTGDKSTNQPKEKQTRSRRGIRLIQTIHRHSKFDKRPNFDDFNMTVKIMAVFGFVTLVLVGMMQVLSGALKYCSNRSNSENDECYVNNKITSEYQFFEV